MISVVLLDPEKIEREIDPGMASRYLDVIDDYTGRWSLLCVDHYVRLTHIGALLREKAELLHRFRHGFMHAAKRYPTHLRLMCRWGREYLGMTVQSTMEYPPSAYAIALEKFFPRATRKSDRVKCPYCRCNKVTTGGLWDVPVQDVRDWFLNSLYPANNGWLPADEEILPRATRLVEEQERDFESLKKWACEAHRHFLQQNLWAARDWIRELDLNRVTLEVSSRQSADISERRILISEL